MPGLLYSPVGAFPQETRLFEFTKAATDVREMIAEGTKRPNTLRNVSAGIAFESAGLRVYNPSVGDAIDFDLILVTPEGEFRQGSTSLGPQSFTDLNLTVPLDSESTLDFSLLATSVGTKANVFVTPVDVTGHQRRTLLTTDWQAVYPVPGPGEITAQVGTFLFAWAQAAGATIEIRIVKEGFPTLQALLSTLGANGFGQLLNAANLDERMSVEARLTAGSAMAFGQYIPRPKTLPAQVP